MGNIVLMMSVSADGFIEGLDRDIGWHRVDDELHRHFNEVAAAMGAFLDGRVTWELMAGFWPTADRDPASTPPMVEFASIWRDTPRSSTPGPWSGPAGTPPSSARSTPPRSGAWPPRPMATSP